MKKQESTVSAEQPPTLAELQTFEQAAKARASVFGSVHSLRHTFRKDREEYFRRGAVKEIGGRLFVVPVIFDQAVLDLSSTPRKSQQRAA